MKRTSLSARCTAFAFAFALVLKAAVPMLASASAALQGVAVGEVCTVYGVATIPVAHAPSPGQTGETHDSGHPPDHIHAGHGGGEKSPSHGGAAQGGDHCALTALIAFAGGSEANASVAWAAATGVATRADTGFVLSRRDDAARWASLVAHAPPAPRQA